MKITFQKSIQKDPVSYSKYHYSAFQNFSVEQKYSGWSFALKIYAKYCSITHEGQWSAGRFFKSFFGGKNSMCHFMM